MKITANAGALADALALAASICAGIDTEKFPLLTCVRITAVGAALAVSANALDCAVTLNVPGRIENEGQVAVSASRLARLIAGFPRDSEIKIAADGNAARITFRNHRYRLAAVPLSDLPPMLRLTEEIGRTGLAQKEARDLFARTVFAISTEKSRHYLSGVLLHDAGNDLVAVATDGRRLVKLITAGAGGLSSDRRLVVPLPVTKIVPKLLGDRDIERVALSRSKTLFRIETNKFDFVSKMVDTVYPDYERIIPAASGSAVTVERAALAQALERMAAVAQADRPIVGLRWSVGKPALRLSLVGEDDAADDSVEAVVIGEGCVALLLRSLAELFDELPGAQVRLDANGASGPVLINSPNDGGFLALDMPCRWPQAA